MSLETPFPRLPGRSSCPWAPHPRRLHPKLDLEGTCCRPFQKLPLLVVPEKHHEHFNIAMEHGPFIDDFPIKASIYKGFSTAMSNNQRVGWWTESWEKKRQKGLLMKWILKKRVTANWVESMKLLLESLPRLSTETRCLWKLCFPCVCKLPQSSSKASTWASQLLHTCPDAAQIS